MAANRDAVPAGNVASSKEAAVVAAASFTAGAVHLAAADAHVAESSMFAAFFLVLGVAQAAWAVLVLGNRQRGIMATGAIGSAGVIVVWILSRTTGLPIGPHPGEAEPAGMGDTIASALQFVVLICAGGFALRTPIRRKPATASTAGRLPALLVASLGVLAASVLATALTPLIASGHQHAETGHGSIQHLAALGAMGLALVAVTRAAFEPSHAHGHTERRSI